MSVAGFHDSFPIIRSNWASADAACVWASLCTRWVVLSCHVDGVPQCSTGMAVLIQEMRSSVLLMVNPVDLNANLGAAEVSPGQGEILAAVVAKGAARRFYSKKNLQGKRDRSIFKLK